MSLAGNLEDGALNNEGSGSHQVQLLPPLAPYLASQNRVLFQQQPYNQYQQPAYRQPIRPMRRQPATMRDLAVPMMNHNTWPICLDPLDDFEVDTNMMQFLPKFAGLSSESATRYLQEFNRVCHIMKPCHISEDRFKLSLFPFSLTHLAKDWFLSLLAESIYTWDQMQKKFLEKYYPPGQVSKVRRELLTIKQGPMESTHDYVERFTKLERSCVNLGVSESILVESLLEGLRPMERRLLDAAAGGSVMNQTPEQAQRLIENMADTAWFTNDTDWS